MSRPDPLALWVLPVGNLGGVARHALDVAGAGIPGWRLVFLCPEGPVVDALRDQGAAVLVAEFGPQAGLKASLRSLRRAIRHLGPALVHTHLAYADIAAALALTGRGVPLVSTEHGIAPVSGLYQESPLKARIMAAVHSLRLRAFSALIAVCESTRDVMEERWHPHRPIHVILNGVDPVPNQQLALDEDGVRVASISRLAPEKRIDLLLDAFSIVHQQRPDARLTLAGEGPIEQELRAQVDRLGLQDAVLFPGHVEASRLLTESSVVVQLSAWENCSYTLLDARAHRRAVVATPVGGNPEFLPTACLASDLSPTALADQILEQSALDSPGGLPSGWPTVAEMCRQIGRVYGRLAE